MRILELHRRWRELQRSALGKDFPKTLTLGGGDGLPAQLELPSPLTLLFGLNGAGKTRILNQLAPALGDGRIVSLHSLITYLHQDFGIRSDVAGFLEETEPLKISSEILHTVKDLVRRDYGAVSWYVIPIADSPFRDLVGEDIVPVFEVEYGNVKYDFRSMGLGELSAHLISWLLSYLREAGGSPLLFDEPEAFLPPPSREVLLSHFLEHSLKNQVPIILASHSLELIQGGLDANAALLVSETGNVATVIGPSSVALADHAAALFGRSRPTDWLILCEDECAQVLSNEILRNFSPKLWQRTKFLWCKGYGDLEVIWKHLPKPPLMPEGLIRFAFFADGDMAESVSAAQKGVELTRKWPLALLPGDPDLLMKASADGHVEFLATQLDVTEAAMIGLLSRIRGREEHNWVEEVLAFSEIGRQPTLRALAKAVCIDLELSGSGIEFSESLKSFGMGVD